MTLESLMWFFDPMFDQSDMEHDLLVFTWILVQMTFVCFETFEEYFWNIFVHLEKTFTCVTLHLSTSLEIYLYMIMGDIFWPLLWRSWRFRVLIFLSLSEWSDVVGRYWFDFPTSWAQNSCPLFKWIYMISDSFGMFVDHFSRKLEWRLLVSFCMLTTTTISSKAQTNPKCSENFPDSSNTCLPHNTK